MMRPSIPTRLLHARRCFVFAFLAALSARADDAATRPAYWGSPSADEGKCCASLAEVRRNIDRIDGELIRLMAERQQYVGEAGRFKKDQAAVSDPKRVDAVIAKVRTDAAGQGLDPAVAEKTFRAMIAAFEDYERAEWIARQAQPPK
jgi:isochorismate pyruvate lyase